jgi:hypothetical protein
MSENSRLQAKLDSIVKLYEQAIELARQEEREECLLIGNELRKRERSKDFVQTWESAITKFQTAIRARGEVK